MKPATVPTAFEDASTFHKNEKRFLWLNLSATSHDVGVVRTYGQENFSRA